MALHKKFPKDKFEVTNPEYRWFPANEDLREKGYEKLLPPLVPGLRKEVAEWRSKGYEGASETSKALLRWWFIEPHNVFGKGGEVVQFQYYFAQREAVETVVWLYDVAGTRSKIDLIKYDEMGRISLNMFDEDWLRLVTKMATGSGKTKVISLLLAWAYFHRMYEKDSELARNFLVIAPNIIVLDRIKTDFEGLKIFYEDPVLPENGYMGQNWENDFQMSVHFQDDVGGISPIGNIFLTNIHRVYSGNNIEPSFEDENTMDYFLGEKPKGATNDSKIDLGDIVRDIDELIVINDEAHHIHDSSLAWFKSIEDIHNQLKLKGSKLALQLDVTATPKDSQGRIFVQTISDYPLVEAIYQEVVKMPVLPDQASRAKLEERESIVFTERYEDYLRLGVEEWKKTFKELEAVGKKSVLFVMTDDTKNCDDVAGFLESQYPELKDAVLTIHTNRSGKISENVAGKKEKELQELRKQSNEIDSWESPYKAIVSVLMLKEGWDTKNVTTIVGLRAYSSKSNILPEQTLGRGLRKMFFGTGKKEYVSVLGTPAFMDFVESIKSEGVELTTRSMNGTGGSGPITPTLIEIDRENLNKDIQKLDIELPVLTPRIQREYKNLSELDVSKFSFSPITKKEFSKSEQQEIVFEDVVEKEEHHKTQLKRFANPTHQSVLGFFTQTVMKELRLFGCYDVLFEKMKEFVQNKLFGESVDLSDLNILRNLSEVQAKQTIIETFKKNINDLTIHDVGDTEIKNYIKLTEARPFVITDNQYLKPKKSVFNKIVGDSNFELEFADFLDESGDIFSFAKNYQEIHFKIDYKNSTGMIANYYPDFFAKDKDNIVWIIETKGREDLDDIEKIKRLYQWCKDASNRTKRSYKMLYIKQEDWDKYKPKTFSEVIDINAFELPKTT